MDEWKSFIQQSIAEIKKETKESNRRLVSLEIQIALLNSKSGIWGLLGGLIPASIILAWMILKR